MDAYSGYNQIQVDHMDAPITSFMSNHEKYYYNVMPFCLKNASATYQWLMDATFVHLIGRNLEVCVDDIIFKTTKGHSRADDQEDILQSVRMYDMCLNPAKCSIKVLEGKFLGFMLTMTSIEANPDKCQTFIDMMNPTNVKEVQQLMRRLASLSRFLSCAADKAFLFFIALRKKVKFEWTTECEEYFAKVKELPTSPLILTR